MKEKKYGLFTAITMIVGIVIGSGIFFKSDNILIFTGGNVFLGVVVFCFAATAIVFGSLTISELASRTDKAGGLIAYADEFCSPRVACAFGWFQALATFPTLAAVVAWVGGFYTFTLFGIESTLLQQVLLGGGYIIFFYLLNLLSAKLGGYFQNASTIIKMIPLILFAVVGLIYGDPQVFTSSVSLEAMQTASWTAAIGPVAFAFDGWVVSTSISHEIKDAKRNLPVALVFAPICILAAYVLYFVGLSNLLGPDQIMAMGDSHVDYAANMLFGAAGAKIVLVFIIISVLGTVNGLALGSIRLPYSLALRDMFPGKAFASKMNEKLSVPVNSGIISLGITLIWMFIHYITQEYSLLYNTDVSEITIVVSYLSYVVLYYQVFRLARAGKVEGVFRGYVFPALATLGSAFILMGGMQNPQFPIYLVICALFIGASQIYFVQTQCKK